MVASPYTSRFYRLLISVGVGALISYCAPNLHEPEGSLIEASVAQIETCLRENLLTEMSQPWGAPRRKKP